MAIASPPLPNEYPCGSKLTSSQTTERDPSMKSSRVTLASAVLATAMGSVAPAHSGQDNPKPIEAANLTGLHDFDFLVGQWRSHHRRLKERLAGSHEWEEFEGTLTMRKLMDGWANVDDNVLKLPGDEYRAVALRAYDPKTGQWAIWWLDGRNPFGQLRPAGQGPFRERRRHLLCRRHAPRQADPRAVRLVADHAHLRSLGTGLFTRWRKDLGDELDHGVPAGLVNADES